MPGISSAASLSAQTGPTRVVTSDAAGNLATASFSPADLSSLQSNVAGLQNQVTANQREARSGAALALAATGLHYDTRPGKASLAAAFGNFKGQSGIAAGIGYALTDSWRFNAAFTASPQQSDYGFVVGGSVTLN
jgi:autotransporter adhesin